ncbi:MAG: cbb3-type cytochrome c oxidase subunit 3 [Stenotrophomonas sp.]
MLSGIITTFLLLLFIALWIWAWQPRLRNGFEATARLAVDDEVPAGEEITGNDRRENA